jgi:peptidoglycan/LPS O-acetylase OafA/YrhL
VRTGTGPSDWRLGYRPALDGLRGIAVLLVLAQHALVPGFARSGTVGVTMFFVLSGFLITTLLLEERERGRINLGAFYLRRARRLLPALVLFLVVMAVIGVGADMIAASAFYYANWLHIARDGMEPLGHVWSLSVEEQFYILWPLVLIVLSPTARWLAVGLGVSVVLRMVLWFAGETTLAFFSTFTRADGLLGGCLLAYAFAVRPWQPARWMVGAAIAGLVLVSVIGSLDFLVSVGIPLTIAASAVLIAVAAQSSPTVLTWRPLVYVGTISYGLYLWHGPLLSWGRQGVEWWAMGTLIVGAFAIAAVSYRYVERPFLRRRSTADGEGHVRGTRSARIGEGGGQGVGGVHVEAERRTDAGDHHHVQGQGGVVGRERDVVAPRLRRVAAGEAQGSDAGSG